MKPSELIQLFEFAKTFNKEVKPVRLKKEKPKKEKNFFELFNEMKQQVDAYQQFIKDQEKLNKKEDKKKTDEDEGMKFIHVVMITVLLSAMQGPFYFYMFGKLFGKW